MDTDINKILESLSDSDIANLKQVASQIFGGDTPTEDEKPEEDEFPQLNLKALTGLMKTFKRDDPRLDLIRSLKPLLSDSRQRRADEAIRMLRMFDMIPALQNSGILGELMK